MTRLFCLLVIVALAGASLLGCGSSTTTPQSLTPEQERELEQQVDQARQAEGGGQ